MHPAGHRYLTKLTAGTIFFIVGIVFVIGVSLLFGFSLKAKQIQKSLSSPTGTLTPEISMGVSPVIPPTANITPQPTVSPTADTSCKSDNDCILDDTSKTTAMQICCNNTCSNYFDATVIAVNKNWLAGYKGSICSHPMMCPMIAMMCTKQATQSHTQVSATCQNHTCVKITQQ